MTPNLERHGVINFSGNVRQIHPLPFGAAPAFTDTRCYACTLNYTMQPALCVPEALKGAGQQHGRVERKKHSYSSSDPFLFPPHLKEELVFGFS